VLSWAFYDQAVSPEILTKLLSINLDKNAFILYEKTCFW